MKGLSINIGGRWTKQQIKRVIPLLKEEGRPLGLNFKYIEVTTHEDECEWFMIVVYCLRHDHPLNVDQLCDICIGNKLVFPPRSTYL